MSRREALERVATVIHERRRFLATCHIRPDGDAVGSLLAFRNGLIQLGKEVVAVTSDPVAAQYAFLPGMEAIVRELPDTAPAASYDAGVALDCDGLARTGSVGALLEATGFVIDIDHHEGIHAFGDVRCIDPAAPCTADLVLELLVDVMGCELTEELATCLLAGHVYDTGRFAQSNATPAAFRNAARLVEAGADPERVARALFETRSLERARLRGRAMERARLDAEYGIAWTTVLQSDLADIGAVGSDTDGIIDEVRAIAGSRLACLIVELKDGTSKVSLRTRNGGPNVAEFASRFGGGGHERAAGCEIPGDAVSVAERLLTAARELLGPCEPSGGGA